jgi:hypothetical protein
MEQDTKPWESTVVFRVVKSKAVVTKKFDSPYLARKFVNKCKHSDKVTLIAWPLFD